MLRWDRLRANEKYVLDLTQRADGLRRIKLRHETETPHENTVFTSQPYPGRDLSRWVNELTLTEHVKLRDGGSFVEEAHGGWLTIEEFAFLQLPKQAQDATSDGDRPWVNGMPPVLPSC